MDITKGFINDMDRELGLINIFTLEIIIDMYDNYPYPLSIKHFMNLYGSAHSNTNRTLRLLEKRGHVQVSLDPQIPRKHLYTLTESAKETVDSIVVKHKTTYTS